MDQLCIVLADASRARVYTFLQLDGPPGERTQELVERIDLANPERRHTPSELFSEPRPGSERAPTGRQFTAGDHRDAHIHELDRRFAVVIMGEFDRLIVETGSHRAIIAASPAMLGELRKAAAALRARGIKIDEIDRDLTRFRTAEVHDYLANRGLLPTRERPGFTAPADRTLRRSANDPVEPR